MSEKAVAGCAIVLTAVIVGNAMVGENRCRLNPLSESCGETALRAEVPHDLPQPQPGNAVRTITIVASTTAKVTGPYFPVIGTA